MIKKAVIPLAGLGTRFLPVTKVVPKELFPLGKKPALLYLLEECVNSGIDEVILVISPRKELIKKFLTKDEKLIEEVSSSMIKSELKKLDEFLEKLTLHYVTQDKPNGTADAIYQAKNYIEEDEDFVILYGDDYINSEVPATSQLIRVHDENHSNVLGVRKGVKEEVSLYGILSYQGEKVKAIVEKPKMEEAPSLDISIGRYLVNAKIFDVIEKLEPSFSGEYLFTDAINQMMEREDFSSCIIQGNYFDLGSQKGFLDANLSVIHQK